MEGRDIVHEVAQALAREPRVELTHRPLRVGLDHGDLVLEGEVRDVAAKKLAFERAAAIPGVTRIVDKLHVAARVELPDRIILDELCDALGDEPLLKGVAIVPRRLGLDEAPPAGRYISVSVERGIVTLDGTVDTLLEKRIAGVLAWWTPGVRDVVNALEVQSPESDADAALEKALRTVFEKDPSLAGRRIEPRCRGTHVRLEGVVANEEESRSAERDAWNTFGVDEVENALRIDPALASAPARPTPDGA